MNRVERFEGLFRQLTPLFLLLVLVAVVLEPWLPLTFLRQTFGADIVLRAAVAALAGYVLLLWGESLRLHHLLSGVLQAFRQFERDRAGETRAPADGWTPKRLEAARLLVAAMRSDDASIRATSRHNLARLCGQDLGDDPAVWQRWLDERAAR